MSANHIPELPHDVEETTAQQVVDHYAGLGTFWLNKALSSPREGLREAVTIARTSFAIAYLTRALRQVAPAVVDEIVRTMLAALDDGGTPGELMWEWLAESGIDPAPIQAAAEVKVPA